MNLYSCENGQGDCPTHFHSDKKWEAAHAKREKMEKENLYDETIYIYCKKCNLPINRRILLEDDLFRYVVHA